MLAVASVVTVPPMAAFGASAPVVDWTAGLTVAPSVASDTSVAPHGVVEYDGEVLVPVGDGIDRFDVEDGALLSSLSAPPGVSVADVAADAAGGVFAVGTVDDAGDPQIWVGRYDATDTLVWSDSFGMPFVDHPDAPDEGVDRGTAVAVDDSGGVYVGGNIDKGSSVTVRKYDDGASGPIFAWEELYGEPFVGVADLDVADGNLYVVGEEFGPNGVGYARRIDASNGTQLAVSNSFLAGGRLSRATGVDATDTAVYVSGGSADFTVTGGEIVDAQVVKLDPLTLDLVWSDMIGTTLDTATGDPGSWDWANDVVVDGTAVHVTGTSDDPAIDEPVSGLGGSGGFLRQLTDEGTSAIVDYTLLVPPGQGLGSHADGIYLTGTDTSGDGTCGVWSRGDLVTGDCFLARLLHTAPNSAPTADAGGPYAVDEGATVTLDGTSSSDADGLIVSYAWSPAGQLDDATSATPSFTAVDDGVVEVTLTVTDDDGATGTDTATVTVANVVPTVEAGVDETATVGETVSLDPAGFTDPGAADTHTATIDWGDGTVEAGTVDQTAHTVTGSHAYTAAGTYTVELCVVDDDTGTGCDTLTATITDTPNSAPTAVDDQTVTWQGQPVVIDVLANDTDVDADELAVTNLTQPAHGAATVNGDETVTYTPDGGFVGTDTFTYTAHDSQADSGPAIVTVHVLSTDKLLASDGDANDSFGRAVAVSGNRIVIGAYADDDHGSSSGSAYVYEPDGAGGWTETKLTASDGAASDLFGFAVAVSGDRIVVGARNDDDQGSSSGSAYVYEPDGAGGWTETKLTASDGAAGDEFGNSVAVSGDRIVVGAFGDAGHGSPPGSAYVYEPDGAGGWTETKLTASDGAASDLFGFAVAVSGDRIVVGARNDDDQGSSSGSAYVYEPDGAGGWTETKLTASDGAAGDEFGFAVAVSGDRIVVGAWNDDDHGLDSGSAYVYEPDGAGGWTETKLTASDGAAGDLFGVAVAVSGDRAVIGASDDDDHGSLSGSAYVFDLADTDTTPPTLTVPAPITVEAPGPDGAVVTFTVTATDDTDPDPAVACEPASGTQFAIGDTTVVCTATDSSGNSTAGQFVVTVTAGATTFDGFAEDVAALDLPQGTSNSLIRKIEAAQQQFLKGDVDDALGTLQSLIDQVDALDGKKLTAAEAQQVRTAAETLIAAIAP